MREKKLNIFKERINHLNSKIEEIKKNPYKHHYYQCDHCKRTSDEVEVFLVKSRSLGWYHEGANLDVIDQLCEHCYDKADGDYIQEKLEELESSDHFLGEKLNRLYRERNKLIAKISRRTNENIACSRPC